MMMMAKVLNSIQAGTLAVMVGLLTPYGNKRCTRIPYSLEIMPRLKNKVRLENEGRFMY